jgi:hypothetical protein
MNKLGIVLGAGTVIVVIALVVSSLLYAPGPTRYTLTPSSLTIHDRFYPVTLQVTDVDAEHIRVVDIDREQGWQPTERTDGFGSLHYHSGWFRVSSGKVLRIYRADGRRLVLLPPKGDHETVLLETKEPEKFVREITQLWAHPH